MRLYLSYLQANSGDVPIRRYFLMGRGTRHKPRRLPEKLLQIRTALGLSQNGIVRRLGAHRRAIPRVYFGL